MVNAIVINLDVFPRGPPAVADHFFLLFILEMYSNKLIFSSKSRRAPLLWPLPDMIMSIACSVFYKVILTFSHNLLKQFLILGCKQPTALSQIMCVEILGSKLIIPHIARCFQPATWAALQIELCRQLTCNQNKMKHHNFPQKGFVLRNKPTFYQFLNVLIGFCLKTSQPRKMFQQGVQYQSDVNLPFPKYKQ